MKKWLFIFFFISTKILWGQEPQLLMPTGHTDWIFENIFTRDSRFIYTASNDKTVKIWNVQSRKIENILYLNSEVKRIVMSPDSVHCLFSLNNGDQTFWNLRTKIAEFTLQLPAGTCNRAVYSSDGRFLILCFWDFGAPILFDCKNYTYTLLRKPEGIFSSQTSASFIPGTNKLLILDEEEGTAYVYSTDSGRYTNTLKFKSKQNYVQLNFLEEWTIEILNNQEIYFIDRKKKKLKYHDLPDSSIVQKTLKNPVKMELAIVANTGLYIVRPKELFTLNGHSSVVESLTYSKDGNLLATASFENTILVWDMIRKKLLFELDANVFNHDGLIMYMEGKDAAMMQFSEDGNFLVVRCVNNTSKVYNMHTGKLHMELKGHTRAVKDFEFDPLRPQAFAFHTGGGGMLSFTNDDTNIYVVNLIENLKITRLHAHRRNIYNLHYSPNGMELQSLGGDSLLNIWNPETGKLKKKYELKKYYFDALTSPNDSFLLVYENNRFKIYRHGTHKVVRYSDSDEEFSELRFSPDSKFILGKTDSGFQIYDFINDSVVFYKKKYGNLTYSPTGKRLLGVRDSMFYLFNGKTFNFINSMQFYRYNKIDSGNYAFIRIAYNLEENLLATYIDNSDSMVSIWDANTGKFLCNILHFAARINYLGFSNDQKYLITVTKNGLVRYWDTLNFRSNRTWYESKAINLQLPNANGVEISKIAEVNFKANSLVVQEDARYHFYSLETGVKLYSLLIIDTTDFIWMLPNNVYYASKNAMDKLSWYYNGNIYDFDQWDLQYNRPDKVLEALSIADTALIAAYRNAYVKRVKKLGLDTSQIQINRPAPVIKINNATSIGGITRKPKLELNISAFDTAVRSGLQRLNVLVNEVSVYGKNGLSIHGQIYNQNLEIALSEGFNTIKIYCTNLEGNMSLARFVYTTYQPPKPQKQKVYFVGLGVAQFEQEQYNLKYSNKDIRDLAVKLRIRYKDTLEIDTLFNSDVTAENLKDIKLKLLKTSVNDKVIVAYSGHGLLSKEYDYFLSTYNVDFDHPEINGLPYEALENLLDSIPARQKLMLIDACHSGEVDKDEALQIQAMADSLGLSKGSKIRNTVTLAAHLGLSNSFELMQELFVNVGKGTGATVISASAGSQFALERGDLQNGVFTYSILEAMKNNPSLTVSQLKAIVGTRVVQLTNGMQKPTSRNETIYNDWRVW